MLRHLEANPAHARRGALVNGPGIGTRGTRWDFSNDLEDLTDALKARQQKPSTEGVNGDNAALAVLLESYSRFSEDLRHIRTELSE